MNAPTTLASRVVAIRTSIWFLPTVLAAGAVALGIGLSVLELRLALPVEGVLPSGPAGARALLSSIITAMISFTALVFSITVVALQLASSQYSPRVLRTFLQDRGIQAALGTFVATFLFAMVVLAALPDRSEARLPELSLAVSMVLVLCSSGLFIYYLHHITTVMRVSHIIAATAAQTRRSIDENYPGQDDRDAGDIPGPVDTVISAAIPGVVDDVDLRRVADIARRHGCAISVVPTPGEFVVAGAPLLHVHRVGDTLPPPMDASDMARTVSVSIERTPRQDVGFGFRQLADIAERALSPGINDVTTAVRAVQEMHDLLRRLAVRPDHPRRVTDPDGTVRASVKRQRFETFLTMTVDGVREAARGQRRVVEALDALLRDLDGLALPAHRAAIHRRLHGDREARPGAGGASGAG